ncbi:hypothetical protein SAMD00023353_5700050 [Rosellinia necatrix]|uniref:Cyclin-D1-binding protein 1-like N-terminal domain-containing protein n=1 Tax=Rosellinia necatrix TaxID=77044 RepID=A0A1W2TX77_ROSNE|nr:hypothetical protein SAMD00023353_5700050 [Rosellinia necatrix]
MPPQQTDSSLGTLKSLVESAVSLITQLETTLHSVALGKDAHDSSTLPAAAHGDAAASSSVDAFALAHDSAALVRAHTTKLSLLIINEPFTPSAIATVLRELVAGPIPAIASAVQLCTNDTYTAIARQSLGSRCYFVLKELRGLVEIVPLNGEILPAHLKNGNNGGKGSLVATGVIWAACDAVTQLKKLGVAGLLAQRIEQHRETLQDVLNELKEWSEEIDEEESDEDGNDHEENSTDAQQMIDDLMRPQRIPQGDPDRIRERLGSCLKRLRLTTLLYSAIIKRRINTLPSIPSKQASFIVQRLNEVYPILKRLPDHFGDVAFSFYQQETLEIDSFMDSCFFDAFAAAELLKAPWSGTHDAFTEWADKFQTSIKKPD